MIRHPKKNIVWRHVEKFLVVFLFLYASSPFAGQLNDNKESFFNILSQEIPKTRDIIYITKTYRNTPTAKGKSIATVKAIKKNGKDGISIIEGKYIFSIQISPDKSKLLLIAPDHSPEKNNDIDWMNSHIWLYGEGKLKQLTSGRVIDSDAIFSVSGDKIYFTRSKIFSDVISGMLKTTKSNIWVMNPDGSEPLQLTFSEKNIINITPIPIKDSKKILFTTNRNEKWQMFVMDEDGTNQKFFIDNGMLGRWSPDGKLLAYMDTSPGNIYLANRDGQLIRRLTEESDVNFAPTWSPDSQYLTYSRINSAYLSPTHSPGDKHSPENIPKGFLREEPYADIWKLSIDKKGEGAKRLTNQGLNNNFPHWIQYR